MNKIWNEVINWWKKHSYRERVIILLLIILAALLCYVYPDGGRNLIFLIAGLIGWYFLFWRTKAARQSAKAAEQSLSIEQLFHAIQQLDSEKPFVRLGGVLGLEQIAVSNEEERKKIARILVSFIRTEADLKPESIPPVDRIQRLDIEAAVNALARIASKLKKQGQFREQYNEKKHNLCDLQNTDLRSLRFVEADLSEFDLAGADLSGAWLAGASLVGAKLCRYTETRNEEVIAAKLTGVFLKNTNLSKSELNFVDFRGSHPECTNFSDAYLHSANFSEVQMIKVNFSRSILENANFTRALLEEGKIGDAILKDANLTGASLLRMYDLKQNQLDEAFHWKGHSTFVSSVDENPLDPPPEREKLTEEDSA
ncbi:MAG: pentapeptide repeat-containing protein [Hyphomicrobiales bacterium]|nr:pentapeptide repeat-containing protein [Hyphomicrobiales bacterium]